MSTPTQEPDPYDSPEYQAFVDSMVPFCHCARMRPCDGVLAGGMCDDIQDMEDPFDEDVFGDRVTIQLADGLTFTVVKALTDPEGDK